MGQALHRSARTTAAVRRVIQHRQASVKKLAERYDINPKTVAKWQKRTDVHDAPMGPKPPRSTTLTPGQEAMGAAFRRHTLWPPDDGLDALHSRILRLPRSSWHRCFQRHGISRLPEVDGDKPIKKKFKTYPLGYFHLDMAEVHTEEGHLYPFVAIDRASKFGFAELHECRRASACKHALTGMGRYRYYMICRSMDSNEIERSYVCPHSEARSSNTPDKRAASRIR